MKKVLFLLLIAAFACASPGMPPPKPYTYGPDICSQCDRLARTSYDDLVTWLKYIPPSKIIELFDCNFPNMGERIPGSEYGRLIRTKPTSFDWSRYAGSGVVKVEGEYWDVRWAWGFDAHSRFLRLLPGVNVFEPMLDIKKQFPHRSDQDEPIKGWTTFGFDGEHDARLDTTPNRVFKASLETNGKSHQVLMMKYMNRPWYDSVEHESYVDYFKFLTEKVVIAQGLKGRYSNDDHLLPKDAKPYSYQQFWMERKPFSRSVDLSTDTGFFSTSIIRELWLQGSPRQVPNEELYGRWEVDLIMNSCNKGGGSLVISPADGSLRLPTEPGVSPRRVGRPNFDQRRGATILEIEDHQPLELRKASEHADVLVGKVCFNVSSEKEVRRIKECHQFLNHLVKTNFLSQYFEPFEPFEPVEHFERSSAGEKRFCNYYLLRKRGQ